MTGTSLGGSAGLVLLVVHAAAVWFLTGLIATVQGLVYPGLAAVGPALDRAEWVEHHADHLRGITRVVAPPWAVQGLTCAILLVARPPGVPFALAAVAGLCGATTVAVTVLVSVPCHRRLADGFDAMVARRLVVTNRWRTAAWSAGAVVAAAMLLVAA